MKDSNLILETYDNPSLYRPYEAHCADHWRNLNHDNRLITLITKGVVSLQVVEKIIIMDHRVDLLGTSIVIPETRLKQICWFTKYEYNKLLQEIHEF